MGELINKEKVHLIPESKFMTSLMKEISKDSDDSILICNISDVIEKHKIWTETMPRVIPHYAVKANAHPLVIKVLSKLGAGYDCASKGEIEKVLSLGVEPDKIIFANPAKFPSHIEYAKKHCVDLMTFDSAMELYKTKNIYPNARLVLRFRCDSPTAIVSLGSKFGCDPKYAVNLLKIARTLDLNVIGVCFHVGTEVKDPQIYNTALSICREIFDDAKDLGYNFTFVDIGGGFDGAKGSSLESIAEIVNEAIEQYFPNPSVKIISEPGCYFVASAFTLICKVHGIRSVPFSKNEPKKMKYLYYINDSVFKNFNMALSEFKENKPVFLKNFDDQEQHLSTIWGQSLHSADCILPNAYLPKLKLGDYMIFENMGAYTTCLCTPFNGFRYPDVYNIIQEKDRIHL